ncbi:hypothetical protein ACJIZ3_015672 [Penstemon smallii]|uniref:Uncharacterized protein n=1 Tax=Penstemon smallii TaxID=265156 RepID=A0ABD3RN60_9LAMI
MASIAATNPPPPPPSSSLSGGGIELDAIKHVDLSQLSQSELQALSSSSDFVRRTDDVLTPNLDRSVFNESAGSRRQTYSRLHHRSHSRFPGLKPHRQPYPSSDPVSHSIVHFLKHFLNGNHNPPPPPPLPPPPPQEVVVEPVKELGFLGLQEKFKIKRKRGRKSNNLNKRRNLENGVGVELKKVNEKGDVVDFAKLDEKGDELYAEELKRRTVGLDTEEGVLGFLSGLEGQWCSRRRKRKYVDAGVFADVLPTGWKVLLGLRRRDYRVSVYCRRYISPIGQQFMSCREVASFLKSYFGGNDADQHRDQKTCSIQHTYAVSSEKTARPADKTVNMVHDTVAHSTSAKPPSDVLQNDDCLFGIENLPEVQVRDIFECSKCNLTFDEKNIYLQHLFSHHQKTTKKYRVGTPVGEGVIIKDGKFECQFCHKVFEEKRSYSGHVGIHVRNSGKNSNELSTPITVHKDDESTLQEPLPSSSSKMDALVEIAETSVFETPNMGTSEQTIINQSVEVLNIEESQAASSGHEANHSSDPIEIDTEDFNANTAPLKDLNHDDQAMTESNALVSNDYQWNINVNTDLNCLNDSGQVRSSDIEKFGNSNLEMGLRSNDHLEDTPGLTVEDMDFQDGVSAVPLVQSFQFFPPFDSTSNKVEHEFSIVDQKLENVTGFEELRFDDIEQYGFENGQELPCLPEVSLNMGNDGGIGDGFNSSVRFHTEEVMLNTLDTSQLTVCVWCRSEFKLEGIESETPSDSIGYMCPTCKAKISGHFGGGLSIDPHGF